MKRLIALVMIMFVASHVVLAQPVQFNDQALKAAVEDELGVTDQQQLTCFSWKGLMLMN